MKRILKNKCILTNIQSSDKNLKSLLFLPGGAGIQSSYLADLGKKLNLNLNIWTLDYPRVSTDYEDCFVKWGDDTYEACSYIKSPILIGHSFGGCLILSLKDIFKYSDGIVILSATPSGRDLYSNFQKIKLRIPHEIEINKLYESSKSDKNLKLLFKIWVPYYFLEKNYEIGKQFFENCSFNYLAFEKYKNSIFSYRFTWENVLKPVLIFSGTNDSLCPVKDFSRYSLFSNSQFISVEVIKNSGHFCWLENHQEFELKLNYFLAKIYN